VLAPGWYEFDWTPDREAAGIYFVRLVDDVGVAAQRIVRLR
jgi:hypothetical protein